jgi:hypothetical protein
MKLKTTFDCKLILEGTPKPGLEVIVINHDDVIVINREDDVVPDKHVHIMDRDGLYQYYLLDIKEDDKIDIIDYIRKYKEDPEIDGETYSEIFSICKLRNCLIYKEKDMIDSFLKNCETNIYCNSINDGINDFLLISLFLLEHLICMKNYEEAIRIIESISTCNICREVLPSKKCNCCG